MSELTEQDIPDSAKCPNCGAEPTEESVVEHRLSNMGYLHDDIWLECKECGYDDEWLLGVPIGEYDSGDDLVCDSCSTPYRIHRIKIVLRSLGDNPEDIRLRLMCKCPNCNYYPKPFPTREVDKDGVSLMGHPDITGTTEDAEAYGWNPDEE